MSPPTPVLHTSTSTLMNPLSPTHIANHNTEKMSPFTSVLNLQPLSLSLPILLLLLFLVVALSLTAILLRTPWPRFGSLTTTNQTKTQHPCSSLCPTSKEDIYGGILKAFSALNRNGNRDWYGGEEGVDEEAIGYILHHDGEVEVFYYEEGERMPVLII